jgi:hypothetical protein
VGENGAVCYSKQDALSGRRIFLDQFYKDLCALYLGYSCRMAEKKSALNPVNAILNHYARKFSLMHARQKLDDGTSNKVLFLPPLG